MSETKLLDSIGRRNRKHPDRPCAKCGTSFKPAHANSKYCSRECLWAGRPRPQPKPEVWWKNSRGYIEGRVVADGAVRRVKKHRYVMEQLLGRRLSSNEDVHHINGDKTDNRLCNLELISHSEHAGLSSRSRIHPRGYKLNLSPEQREKWREQARRNHVVRKARGEKLFVPRAALRLARGE